MSDVTATLGSRNLTRMSKRELVRFGLFRRRSFRHVPLTVALASWHGRSFPFFLCDVNGEPPSRIRGVDVVAVVFLADVDGVAFFFERVHFFEYFSF